MKNYILKGIKHYQKSVSNSTVKVKTTSEYITVLNVICIYLTTLYNTVTSSTSNRYMKKKNNMGLHVFIPVCKQSFLSQL